jgi:hypothetical protein
LTIARCQQTEKRTAAKLVSPGETLFLLSWVLTQIPRQLQRFPCKITFAAKRPSLRSASF